MGAAYMLSLRSPVWHLRQNLCVLLGLGLLLAGCSTSDHQNVTASTAASPQLEQQAIANLLDLYRQALLQEDIDRLQALLAAETPDVQSGTPRQQATTRQEDGSTLTDAGAFLTAMSTAFRTLTVTGFELLAETVQVAADRRSVTFLEIENIEDPAMLVQQTRLFQTTWRLTPDQGPGVTTFRIGAVRREGPVIQVTTRGQIQAGALTRVEVIGTGAPFPLAGVEVEVPETGAVHLLVATDSRLHGLFTPPRTPSPQPLRVRLRGPQGETMVLSHRYRLRLSGQGVVERIPGTGATRLFAVAVAPDGTVWAGGDGGGNLYRVPPRASRATSVGQLLTEPAGRVEDLVVDQLGRLHAIVFALQTSGDIVVDQGRFCQTVNVFDPAYPFHVRDVQTGLVQPSASPRALAAGGGDIWLFGSDGGVARVTDTFRDGACPARGTGVRYEPIFRREAGGLLSNTVPAVATGVDGTLWFGTAFGLTRFTDGQFTPLPFDTNLSFRGDVTTLEAFFRDVAQALFNAQPLTSVALGTVSFVATFGQPLVKEDLIFSAVVDRQNRLWVGTLGGGIRRIEREQETLHLTHREGLSSNLILALATGPEETIWAATDDGVTRLQDRSGTVTMTSFTALDGLALPVRDVAVDGTGSVWVATDGGLFRIVERGGVVQGVVQNTGMRPVVGADVVIVGTPFRAVTDTEGRFQLENLPPGSHRLQVDGSLAVDGPFAQTSVDLVVTTGRQSVETVVLPGGGGALQLILVSGDGQTGVVGAPLSLPLVVALKDIQGRPVAGIPVTFTVVAGRGTLAPAMVMTDVDGQAASTLTVETTVSPIRVQVSAVGQTVVFTATGLARARARLIEVSGNRQVAAPGEVLPRPLVVRLEDQFGAPVTGAEITATIVQGAGELVSSQTSSTITVSALTDPQGEAAFRLRVGASEKNIAVEVMAAALPEVEPVRFLTIIGFQALSAIAIETNGNLIVTDERLQGVIRVDPASGERTIVSDATTGRGPTFVAPVGLVLEADGHLVVLDFGLAALVRVDPASGERTIVSNATTGHGPRFVTPTAVAVEADGHLVVVDFGLAALVRVDPASGERTIISDATTSRGPRFVIPTAVVVEASGHLIILDSVLHAVVRVDPRSGDRTIVSDATTGQGPLLKVPVGLAIEADGRLILVDNDLDAVIRVDPVSGNRAIVSDATTGQGPPFANPVAIAVEATGHLVVVDRDLATLVRIDPRTGDRTVILRSTIGEGPPFARPDAIAVEATGHLVVVDSGLAAVVRVDLASGDRTIVSNATTGRGPALQSPHDLAVEATGHLVVLDGQAVVRVDPVSGDRTIVSGPTTGRGPLLGNPEGLAVEATGNLLIVGAFVFPEVLRVDPVSGDRTIVSGPTTGRGPLFSAPISLTVEADGHLLVVDRALGAVIRVDPSSGDRTVVSDASTGEGPPLARPAAIARAATGNPVVVDPGRAAVIRVDPISGDRIPLSGGPTARGSGPPLGDPVGLAVAPDGHLLIVDDFFRWVIRVDPSSGNRTLISQ